MKSLNGGLEFKLLRKDAPYITLLAQNNLIYLFQEEFYNKSLYIAIGN